MIPVGKPVHVVDDDVGFLKGMERLLSAHGLDVVTFSSAEAFQARANPDEASCLILDIHLGNTSGIDLMLSLLRSGSRIPVVLVTANDTDRIRRAAHAAGCKAFLQKPFPANALIDAVRSVAGPVLRPSVQALPDTRPDSAPFQPPRWP